MSTYRNLIIWQKWMELVTEAYRLAPSFPLEELYGLSSQIKRSAISIPSNIAEGYGRESKKDYLKFLNIAVSSLFEHQTQLEIAKNLGFTSEETHISIHENTREVERMLPSFIRKIKNTKTLKL